jgi:hypothetical protein
MAAMLAAAAWACHENDPAPWGDPGGGENNSSGIPDAGDTDIDTATDTGTGGDACDENEVEQPGAGLCWQRCPLGQGAAADGTCEGIVSLYESGEAKAACALLGGGAHAATRHEMIALLGGCEDAVALDGLEGVCDACGGSDLCTQLFGADWETYWTSTPGNPAPWAVSFDSGAVFMGATGFELYAARCVRQGG